MLSSSSNSSYSESEGAKKIFPGIEKSRGMKILLSEITQKRFKRSFRGYNRGEVEEFLNKIANSYRELSRENKALFEEAKKLKGEVEGYNSKRKELEEALISIRKSSHLMEENTQRRAELIIKEADLTARRIMEENEKKMEKLREETERLSSQKTLLLTKLRSIIEIHSELLRFYEKNSDKEDIRKRRAKTFSRKTPLPHRPSNTPKGGIVFEEE